MPAQIYTGSVAIGASTKKSDYDNLVTNDRMIASGSFTFYGAKTFLSSTIFSGPIVGTTTVNNLTLHTSTIKFSATAAISLNASGSFAINKPLKAGDNVLSGEFDYGTHSSVEIKNKTGAGDEGAEFYIKKTIGAYMVFNQGGAGPLDMGLQVYQNGGWRDFLVYALTAGAHQRYGLVIPPGRYRLHEETHTTNSTIYLYATSVYARPSVVAAEIAT